MRRRGKEKPMKNVSISSNEQLVILYFQDGQITSELTTVEKLWNYVSAALKSGSDPLDLMLIKQNEYAISRAETWGMAKERMYKYGRNKN
jgi:hypothetical protein